MKQTALLIPEVFDMIRKQGDNTEAKIKLMQENQTAAMLEVLQRGFGDCVSPYEKDFITYRPDDSPHGYPYTTLYKEYSRMEYFYYGPKFIESQKIRERKLVGILESVHWTEANLLENMFTKNLSVYGLTKEIVKEAFPNLKI